MEMKAQAVVIDALFLLILCAISASFLIWASSSYGNESFKAYSFMYMGEYDTGILDCFTELEYVDSTGVHRFFLDEIGGYLTGEFAVGSPRHEEMIKQWHTICAQSPHPFELKVLSRGTSVYDELTLYCPLTPRNPEGDDIGVWLDEYVCQDCGGTPCPACPDRIPLPPYYSSGSQTKICGRIGCIMEAKIYY